METIEKTRGKNIKVVISVTIVLLLSAYVFYKIKKQDFLDHQLKNLAKEKTHGLYSVNYDSISVDEAGGDLYIKNIYIKGDTARQLQMVKAKDTNATSALFDIYVPLIKVVDFKTDKALLSKRLECREVIVSQPKVVVYLFPGLPEKKDDRKKQQELYKQILGNLKLIKADSVAISNTQVTALDFFTREVKFTTNNSSIRLSDVSIDSAYNYDTSRTLFCRQISVLSDQVFFGDKKNAASATGFRYDTRSKMINLAAFEYDAFKTGGWFKTKVEGISVEGITWAGPVENSNLMIDKVVVTKGEIETLSGTSKQDNRKKKQDQKILTGWVRKFNLNELKVRAVNFTSRKASAKDDPLIVRNSEFTVQNLAIDRNAAFNGKLIEQAKEIHLFNHNISVISEDKMYEYKVSRINLNTRTKTIRIKSLKVAPQLSEAAFVKKAHYQTDRIDATMKEVVCSNVNVEKLVKGEIDIGTITSRGNTLKDFRDLSYPIDSASKREQRYSYPQQVLFTTSAKIKIDKAIFDATDIEYKEKNPLSRSSGRVRFSNSYLEVRNISSEKPEQGEKTIATFKTIFLNNIPLTGRFTFSLDEWKKGTFTAEASVASAVDATTLNQLTEPMGLIKLEKGEIGPVKFSMTADTAVSHGTLELAYRDIKISMLKKQGNEYKKKGIVSLFANLLVRNNNNQGKNMRRANVVVIRNRYKSFFNFIWMTVFKGMKDISLMKP